MGEVYKARDTRLDRDVAIKILTERLADDAEALQRFEREAKAVAALSHPNILDIHDFGSEQGLAYAVMELLDGETLRNYLKRSTLPSDKTLEIGTSIAEGLAMKYSSVLFLLLLFPPTLLSGTTSHSSSTLAITNVTVIDGTRAAAKPKHDCHHLRGSYLSC